MSRSAGLADALIGGELSAALSTHSLGVTALGPPGSGSVGNLQLAGHMPSALSAYSTGALGGGVAQQHPNAPKSHPNVTNENSDAPIMIFRVLTAAATHMIPGQDDLVFIHKPRKGEGISDGVRSLASALDPRSAVYATGRVNEDIRDLRALVALNIWALNAELAREQIRLWLTDPELASEMTPEKIWHGDDRCFWTGFTCDGVVRLEELSNGQVGEIGNDGYAVFTQWKKTAKTPQKSYPQKNAAIVRAGKNRMRDIWQSRGTRAGASLHLLLTDAPATSTSTSSTTGRVLRFVTSAKAETGEFTNIVDEVSIPSLDDFHDAADKLPAKKVRGKEMLKSMTQAPPIFQLVPYANETGGGDVPYRFRKYVDAWGQPHDDALALDVGKILHPAFATEPQPAVVSPTDDEGFAAATNGYDAMRRMFITSVVLYPEKDGHMSLA
jgi:hypothetical protein